LIDDALGAGLELEVVLVAEDRIDRAAELARRGETVKVVDADVLSRVSALTRSPGILALCPAPRSIALDELAIARDALIVVVAGVADPGNLGAIARCAEAFGASALVVARGGASPWNDKALRGSMGSLLRIPLAFGASADEIARALASRNVRQVIAATRGGSDPRTFDWSGAVALWLSGETGEVPGAARKFETVTIKMTGRAESLNVTVAAGILLFASGRASKLDENEPGAKALATKKSAANELEGSKAVAKKPGAKETRRG